MYRVLICLCITVAICLTAACSEDDYEQAFAPLDTLDFGPPETTEAITGDADDVMGIVEGDGTERTLDAETE